MKVKEYIGGMDPVEPEMIEGEYYYYLIYQRKGPGRTEGDRRGVLLLFLLLFKISEVGTEWNRR